MPPYDFPSFHFSFPVQIHFLSGKIGKLHQLHTIPIAQTNLIIIKKTITTLKMNECYLVGVPHFNQIKFRLKNK